MLYNILLKVPNTLYETRKLEQLDSWIIGTEQRSSAYNVPN